MEPRKETGQSPQLRISSSSRRLSDRELTSTISLHKSLILISHFSQPKLLRSSPHPTNRWDRAPRSCAADALNRLPTAEVSSSSNISCKESGSRLGTILSRAVRNRTWLFRELCRYQAMMRESRTLPWWAALLSKMIPISSAKAWSEEIRTTLSTSRTTLASRLRILCWSRWLHEWTRSRSASTRR